MITITVNCQTKEVTTKTLTLAEEQAIQARSVLEKAKLAAEQAKLAEEKTARELLANLDPKTATVEQLINLLQGSGLTNKLTQVKEA